MAMWESWFISLRTVVFCKGNDIITKQCIAGNDVTIIDFYLLPLLPTNPSLSLDASVELIWRGLRDDRLKTHGI